MLLLDIPIRVFLHVSLYMFLGSTVSILDNPVVIVYWFDGLNFRNSNPPLWLCDLKSCSSCSPIGPIVSVLVVAILLDMQWSYIYSSGKPFGCMVSVLVVVVVVTLVE